MNSLEGFPLINEIANDKGWAEHGTFNTGDPGDTQNNEETLLVGSLSSSSPDGDHKTTFWQTYIHLVKGYVGCGVLSLPWAISRLGIPVGCAAIFAMAGWSSYNCWTVVKLKRYIDCERKSNIVVEESTLKVNDTKSEGAASSITYPDIGDWAYGATFHRYITACICTQQLAICTVFLSFIAENLHAVFHFIGMTGVTHLQLLSLATPPVMLLSFLPTLKHLAPVMIVGTLLMMAGFACLATIGWIEWSSGHNVTPSLDISKTPLSLCAILYSFEGICLILPVESAMRHPEDFNAAFTWSMLTVACIFATVACFSVVAFGPVSNGSVTAFLLDKFEDDKSQTVYFMFINTVVSFSILLTYPLQLFPALELFASVVNSIKMPGWNSEFNDDFDLNSFEPLPSIHEHETFSLKSFPSQHDYGNLINTGADDNFDNGSIDTKRNSTRLIHLQSDRWLQTSIAGDSIQLRIILVLVTYLVAALVPNVENLISLAGALAGSSTALLIPPIMELAWIRDMQKPDMPERNSTMYDMNESASWFLAVGREDKFFYEKMKSWILFFLGLFFAAVGTYASINDIIRVSQESSYTNQIDDVQT